MISHHWFQLLCILKGWNSIMSCNSPSWLKLLFPESNWERFFCLAPRHLGRNRSLLESNWQSLLCLAPRHLGRNRYFNAVQKKSFFSVLHLVILAEIALYRSQTDKVCSVFQFANLTEIASSRCQTKNSCCSPVINTLKCYFTRCYIPRQMPPWAPSPSA